MLPFLFDAFIHPILTVGERVNKRETVRSSSSHHHYFHFSEKNIVEYLNLVETQLRTDFVAFSNPLDGLKDLQYLACGGNVIVAWLLVHKARTLISMSA